MTTEASIKLNVHDALAQVQEKIKVPKDRDNKFGGYKYRNAEDILDAAKKLAAPLGFHITLQDEIETYAIGSIARLYVKATATFGNETGSVSTFAYAREEETKKGMDGAQITGAASSYARKYALNGLFAIDDGIDSDATNDGKPDTPPANKKGPPPAKPAPAKPPTDIEIKGKQLKSLCEAYGKTEQAKTAPVKALLFDTLQKNGMKELSELKTCTNVNVFSELIDVVEAAMATGQVPA